MDHFGLVQREYLGPALRVVRFDQSGHFGQSDRNVPFHLTKLLFPVLLFCILLTRIITKRVVAWVRSVQPECTVLLGKRNFRNLKLECFVQRKAPRVVLVMSFTWPTVSWLHKHRRHLTPHSSLMMNLNYTIIDLMQKWLPTNTSHCLVKFLILLMKAL